MNKYPYKVGDIVIYIGSADSIKEWYKQWGYGPVAFPKARKFRVTAVGVRADWDLCCTVRVTPYHYKISINPDQEGYWANPKNYCRYDKLGKLLFLQKEN